MKSSAWDNKLWQNKMQEVPLDGDADLAWSEMQGLLDEVMPVTPATPMVKTPWSLPKSRLRTIAYAAAVAAIILFAAYFLLKKQHQKPIKHQKENVKPVHSHADSLKQIENRTDSAINTQPTPGRVTADSLNTDTSSAKNNSTAAAISNKTVPVNGSSKKAVANNTVSNLSKHRGALARSTTTKLSPRFANYNTPVVKGRHGIANSTTQTQNLAASSTSSTGLKNKGNHHFRSRRGAGANNSNPHPPAKISRTNNVDQNGNKNMLADNNASKTNGLITPGPSSAQKGNKPASSAPIVQLSKADSTKTNATVNKVNSAPKPTTANNTPGIKNKPSAQPSTKNTRQPAYSKFEVAIEAGINSGKGSTTPFVGLLGSYAVDPKFSISIGGNIFSSRTIKGKYSIGKYQYTTQDDSTGLITSHTAKNLSVSTSQKLHTLEVPLMASYKLTKWLTIKGGPVISIPIKTGAINNTLSPVGSPLDTARAFKTLSSIVNSTGILNRVNFNLSGGVLINIKRLYFDASYVQETGPYTIFSSLGSGNTYYHYLQIGIGYKLFQSKPKPKPNHN